jgi:hypothetical protein
MLYSSLSDALSPRKKKKKKDHTATRRISSLYSVITVSTFLLFINPSYSFFLQVCIIYVFPKIEGKAAPFFCCCCCCCSLRVGYTRNNDQSEAKQSRIKKVRRHWSCFHCYLFTLASPYSIITNRKNTHRLTHARPRLLLLFLLYFIPFFLISVPPATSRLRNFSFVLRV